MTEKPDKNLDYKSPSYNDRVASADKPTRDEVKRWWVVHEHQFLSYKRLHCPICGQWSYWNGLWTDIYDLYDHWQNHSEEEKTWLELQNM